MDKKLYKLSMHLSSPVSSPKLSGLIKTVCCQIVSGSLDDRLLASTRFMNLFSSLGSLESHCQCCQDFLAPEESAETLLNPQHSQRIPKLSKLTRD
jgi:hypothetical protein